MSVIPAKAGIRWFLHLCKGYVPIDNFAGKGVMKRIRWQGVKGENEPDSKGGG